MVSKCSTGTALHAGGSEGTLAAFLIDAVPCFFGHMPTPQRTFQSSAFYFSVENSRYLV